MTQEQIQEIRYLVGEAWKGAYNPTSVYGNANVVQDTEGLSVYRSLKPGNSGHPLTDQQWWFKIIDMSSIKALYDQMVDGSNTMAENELERVAAEQSRVSAEQSRVNAENTRIYNENQRINDETTRVRAEQDRVTQENQRISQEQGRVGAEQQRVTKEQQRVSQEASRVAAETQRQLNENDRQAVFAEDHAVAVADHEQAEQDHTRAESDHETAVNDHGQMTDLVERADADHVQIAALVERADADHEQADEDHTTAVADHTTATSDHTQAVSDHTTASNDHTTATADHTQAVSDHTRAESDHATAVQDNAQMAALVERADADHEQMAALVERADADHEQAAEDHTTAVADHTTATSDHTQAVSDHTTAANDHTTATADHTQAVSDHATAVQDHETLAPTVAEHTQQIAGLGTSKQDVITDLATIAMGSGVSHDDTYSNIRTSTIANFILLTNATVDILFTTPINAEDATLNVSLTGAKPIRILGQNLPAGVIKAETYVTLAYDGTAWNIVNIFCPDASFDPAALVVDMGLPSGVKWASRDIDLTKPGGFCETPFVYEKSFFSWGNIDGHNPSSVSAFDYDWGGVNQAEPWYEGQPYGSTPGNTLTGNIAVGEDFDAARANLGAPWRMPTSAEYAELFANIRYINADGTEVDTTKADKRVTVNGVLGLYLESTINGARLFFACSGNGGGRSWDYRGSGGFYWSSTWFSARYARRLGFRSGGVDPLSYSYRDYGFALRPVQ